MTVRVLRWMSGWTQKELAARSGVSEGTISRFEGGSRVPSSRTWARLCEAVGVPATIVESVLSPALRNVLAFRSGTLLDLEGWIPGDAEELTDKLMQSLVALFRPSFVLLAQEMLAAAYAPWEEDPPAESDRQGAAKLWAVLRDANTSLREILLEEALEYRSWAVCELACAESAKAAPRSAEQAVEYAELAVEISRLAPGEETFRQRLQGYAEAHLADALRAHGQPREAEAALARARALWEAGAPGDPGWLDAARVPGL